MVNITILKSSLSTYNILKDLNKLEGGNTLYNVQGVIMHVDQVINFVDMVDDTTGEVIKYRRNLLPKSAIVDGSASLTLTPSQKYVLIHYYTENTGTDEEPIVEDKREIVAEYTGSEKLGKVTINDLQPNELYKLATEDSDYSPAYEDVFQ